MIYTLIVSILIGFVLAACLGFWVRWMAKRHSKAEEVPAEEVKKSTKEMEGASGGANGEG